MFGMLCLASTPTKNEMLFCHKHNAGAETAAVAEAAAAGGAAGATAGARAAADVGAPAERRPAAAAAAEAGERGWGVGVSLLTLSCFRPYGM